MSRRYPLNSQMVPETTRMAKVVDLIRASQRVGAPQVQIPDTFSVGLECCEINVTHYDGPNII